MSTIPTFAWRDWGVPWIISDMLVSAPRSETETSRIRNMYFMLFTRSQRPVHTISIIPMLDDRIKGTLAGKHRVVTAGDWLIWSIVSRPQRGNGPRKSCWNHLLLQKVCSPSSSLSSWREDFILPWTKRESYYPQGRRLNIFYYSCL